VPVWLIRPPEDHYYLICDSGKQHPDDPEKNVRARRARDWRWSSARAHLAGEDDELVRVRPLLALAPDWPGLLAEGLGAADH
jgi:putative transposase